MERRRLLRAGLAGLSTGLAGLSGCGFLASDEEPETTTRQTPTPTATGTASPTLEDPAGGGGAAAGHIQTAVGELAANNEAFVQFADEVRANDQPGSLSFDAEAVQDRIETAQTELSTAATGATGDQQVTIEAVRNLALAQQPAAEFFASYATISQQYATANESEASEAYEQALQELDTLDAQLTGAQDSIADTESALDFLSGDGFDSVAVDPEPFRMAFETVRDWYDLYSNLAGALDPLLTGLQQFDEASTAIENERFGTAQSAFREAESEFRAATTAFRELTLDNVAVTTPPGFNSDPEQVVCATDAFATGASLLAESAGALQAGNQSEGEQLAREAQAALDRCELS